MQGPGVVNHTRAALENNLALIYPSWLLPTSTTDHEVWLKFMEQLGQPGRAKQHCAKTTLFSLFLSLWGDGKGLLAAKCLLGRSSKNVASPQAAVGSFAKSDLEKSPNASLHTVLILEAHLWSREAVQSWMDLGRQFTRNIVIT